MILKTPLHNSNYIMLTRLDSKPHLLRLGGYKITILYRAKAVDEES